MKKCCMFGVVLSLACSVIAAPTPFDHMSLKGYTDKANPVDYKVGEPIVFTVYSDGLKSVPTNDSYRVDWERTGDDGKVEKGSSPFCLGTTCVVTTRLDRAGFVRFQAHLVGEKAGSWVQRSRNPPGSPGWENDHSVFFDGGAGAETEKLTLDKPEPKDFDAYWAKQKELLARVPVTAELKELKAWDGYTAYAVTVACAGPRPMTGYLLVPTNAAPKSCKARVCYKGYGAGKPFLPCWRARQGEIVLEINAHGCELEREQAYYDDFFSKIRTEDYQYAFSPIENANPDTAYFHGMVLRVLRSLAYMKTRPEWNGRDLIVEGGSQGGLQATWAAGLDPDVTLALPNITWGCNWGVLTGTRIHGDWHVPWAEGLGYYDSVSHVRRAKCRVEITRAGLGDYTCPPSGLAMYYHAIPNEKSIHWVQGSRHGYVPVGTNQTYTVTASVTAP